MNKLYINASPRGVASYSRVLGDFVDEKIEGSTEFVDLINSKVPYLTNDMIAYNFGGINYEDLSDEDKENVEVQNKYIAQVLNADVIIISVPMWNFDMPAILKAYFDLIIKAGMTFNVGESGFEGLVKNIQKAFVVGARGGKFIGTDMESMDSLTPQINRLLSFMGINNIYSFWLEGIAMSSQEDIKTEIERLKTEIEKAV